MNPEQTLAHRCRGPLRRNLYRSAATMTLDPAVVQEASHVEVTRQLFDGLVQADAHGRPVPCIASHWEIAPDGLTWTFHLRREVRFHDCSERSRATQNGGRAVTAHDFVFAWDRVSDPGLCSPGASYFGYLASWQAQDPFTLEVRLKEPLSALLHILASPYFMVVPREDVAYWGQDFARHPVGTGAFRFVEQQGDRRMLLEANPHYFEGCPSIESVHYVFVPDNAARVEALRQGLLDYEEIPEPVWLTEVQSDPSLGGCIVTQPILGLTYLGMNVKSLLFEGERGRWVRQAICHAIDRRCFVEVARAGRDVVASGILPPAMDGFATPREFYPHDVTRCRALLERAGYPEGQGLGLVTLGHHHSQEHERMAAALQDALESCGIDSTVWTLPWRDYLGRLGTGDVQLYMLSWVADYPDPSSFLTPLFHSKKGLLPQQGGSFYRDPRVDALLDEADTCLDPARRTDRYRQAETLIMEDAPLVPLFHQTRSVAVRPWVHGFYLSPCAGLSDLVYKRLWLEKAPARALAPEL